MRLDELIKEQETKNLKELNHALGIAEREWENIRISLEYCGDIGKFDREDFMIGIIDEDVIVRQPLTNPTKSVSGYSPTYYPMYFLKNILIMEDKFDDLGYNSLEAMYLFVELATKAVSRLGLDGNFAMGFGAGYANVRTGWIAEKGWPEERELFYREFFKGRKTDLGWEFYWTSVKERMQSIFERFSKWKDDPEMFRKETKSKARVKPMMV